MMERQAERSVIRVPCFAADNYCEDTGHLSEGVQGCRRQTSPYTLLVTLGPGQNVPWMDLSLQRSLLSWLEQKS